MSNAISYMRPARQAAPGGHYSHAAVAGGFVFVSGQLPIAPDGNKLADATFEEQTRQVLDNVARALDRGGQLLDRLVQVRVYVTDIALWPQFNTFTRPGPAPHDRRARWCRYRCYTTASRSRSRQWRSPERRASLVRQDVLPERAVVHLAVSRMLVTAGQFEILDILGLRRIRRPRVGGQVAALCRRYAIACE